MSEEDKKDDIAHVPIEGFDEDLICDMLWLYASQNLSEPSQSIIREVLDIRKSHGQSIGAVFESMGRSVFNEILLQALTEKLKREGFIEDDNSSTT